MVEHVLPHPAISDQQVDSPALQLAKIGLLRRRILAQELGRAVEGRAIDVPGGGADTQAAQVLKAVDGVGIGLGIEEYEFGIGQCFMGVEQGGGAFLCTKNIQN